MELDVPPHGESARSEDISEIRAALDNALLSRDRATALAVATDALDRGAISVPELYALVLGPLMTDTGAAWQSGITRIWEEHYASAIVRTIVESLATRVLTEAACRPSKGETVLLACPPDEYHDLGLRMFLDRMLLAGYDAHFLGADTPIAEILDAAVHLNASLVILSVSTHFHRVRLRETIAVLSKSLPAGTRIAVGGPACAKNASGIEAYLLDEAKLGLEEVRGGSPECSP